MGMIEIWRGIRGTMDVAIADLRVVPVAPVGRTPRAMEEREQDSTPAALRDKSSGWALYITYEDSSGETTERRVACRRIERGIGGSQLLGAYCYERESYRSFRIDRIREMIDLSTGEVVDPFEKFEMLLMQGLPFSDRGLATFSKMLVFMTLCDGEGHASEWSEIENALGRYALRFGGDDASVAAAIKACRGLAPDARDFTNCLGAVLRTPKPIRTQFARLAIDACAKIVDADGRHADEEIYWGDAVGRALKRLAV